MRFILGLLYTSLVFVSGWVFNFIFDIQFALGLAAGWFLKEGYDDIATLLQNFAN